MRSSITVQDFMESYRKEKYNGHLTQALAYEATEKKWIEKHKVRFYKNYNSFRRCKVLYIRNTGRPL